MESHQSHLGVGKELNAAFATKENKTGMEQAAALAEEWDRRAQGTLLYSQLYALATFFGCATKPAVPDTDPEPETDPVKLRAGIDAALAEEWAKVLQATVNLGEAPTVLVLTAAGDAMALRKHLGLPTSPPPPPRQVSRRKLGLKAKQRIESEGDLTGAATVSPVDARVTRAAGRAASASPVAAGHSRVPWELNDYCFLGATPLILAADFGYSECVAALLEAAAADGPNPLKAVLSAKGRIKYINGTALTFAIRSDRHDILLALVRAGADLHAPVVDHLNPGGPPVSALQILMLAALSGPGNGFDTFMEVLEVLKSDSDVINAPLVLEREQRPWRRRDEGEESNGNEEEGHPRDIRRVASDGYGFGHRITLDDLEGAMDRMNTGYRRIGAMTMLEMAAKATSCVRVDVIKALLAAGAKPTAQGLIDAVKSLDHNCRRSDTMGIEAAAGVAAQDALLGAASDIDVASDHSKTTALHTAAERGCIPAIKILLRRKANTIVFDEFGLTPQQLAEEHSEIEAAELIERHQRLRRLNSSEGSSTQRNKAAAEAVAAAEANPFCCVCLLAPKTVTLAQCGHKLTCKGCTKKILLGPIEKRKCPICRDPIESYIVKVYES